MTVLQMRDTDEGNQLPQKKRRLSSRPFKDDSRQSVEAWLTAVKSEPKSWSSTVKSETNPLLSPVKTESNPWLSREKTETEPFQMPAGPGWYTVLQKYSLSLPCVIKFD